jgi:hypothetical protein
MIIKKLQGGGMADICSIKPIPSSKNMILKVYRSDDDGEL